MPETTSKDWDAFNIEKTALKKGSERIQPQVRHVGMNTKKRKSGPIVLRTRRKIYIDSSASLAKELNGDFVKCILELARAEGEKVDSEDARISARVVNKVRQRVKSLLKSPAR